MDKAAQEPLSFSNFPTHLANPAPLFRSGGGFLKEFKEFALKCNMVDLAIGVIIGAAFGGLVRATRSVRGPPAPAATGRGGSAPRRAACPSQPQ